MSPESPLRFKTCYPHQFHFSFSFIVLNYQRKQMEREMWTGCWLSTLGLFSFQLLLFTLFFLFLQMIAGSACMGKDTPTTICRYTWVNSLQNPPNSLISFRPSLSLANRSDSNTSDDRLPQCFQLWDFDTSHNLCSITQQKKKSFTGHMWTQMSTVPLLICSLFFTHPVRHKPACSPGMSWRWVTQRSWLPPNPQE